MNGVFAGIEEALEELKKGKMLIVTDDEGRENEGDFVMPAQTVSPEAVNFIALHGRGLLCQAITGKRARELGLPLMVTHNTSLHTTAFTVSVDAREGTSTGISAFDRAATIKALVEPSSQPESLCRPGHIFPLIAREGGVLERDGHTEAAADLARLAGFRPSGILCEILAPDGRMARMGQLETLAREQGLKIVTVADLIRWREKNDPQGRLSVSSPAPVSAGGAAGAKRLAESRLPTEAGNFRVILYENAGKPDQPHLALVSEAGFDPKRALTRIHSECLTGEVLLSSRCDCGEQLILSLKVTAKEGGVVIYLRQEGRGIGLTEKIKAYSLQDTGLDTFDANIKLGHGPDERDYAAAAAILRDMGVTGIRLMTNNPAKEDALSAAGIEVIERVPLEVRPGKENRKYLEAKKVRFGHSLRYV
ncbi:MAG: 3,4-dihydroxy-2-butanone-4-phosphate synthase [Spirochaetales bacterium]|jgi:3,4-dihydroxy 2-butanone 4-phosphate synthase/GTP cyclohydrolase II|nr:3,4-dihydroxy-2-butanone-4-phosphate synthase [Spirochaetales bacterium]